MKTEKLLKLGWLESGDRFEIPSLVDLMRNLKVISTNNSSTSVEGERRDGINDLWKPFRFPISNDVNVKLLEKNAPKIKTDNPQSNTKDTLAKNNENTPPRRRGRPAKLKKDLNDLSLKKEFTVQDIIKDNSIKDYEAHNLIRSAVKNGKAKVVKEVSGGRGKPKKVYCLV